MLRCFQHLSLPPMSLPQQCLSGETTGTPVMRPLRSSRYVGAAPLNSPTPTADRDRTVSRRSKPSSRTTLNGEQPIPLGPTSAPGCDEPTSRCQTPPSIIASSWAVSACYPRSTFYPLSDGPSIQNHRITMTCFRTCSTCPSRS